MALSMHRATGEVDEELEHLGMHLLSQVLRYASQMLPEQLNQMLFSLAKLMDTAAGHTAGQSQVQIYDGHEKVIRGIHGISVLPTSIEMENRSRAMQVSA